MILYHVISTYHLLCAMVHVMRSRQQADLIIYDHIGNKFPHYKELKKVFHSIFLCDINYFEHHGVNSLGQYFNSILPPLSQYEQIYVWAAHYSFGIFLAENRIPFIFCEDGAGLLSRPDILLNVYKQQKPENFHTANDLGLIDGSNAAVSKLFGNRKAQENDYEPPKEMIDFDVVRAMNELPEEQRGQIIQFFVSTPRVHIPTHASLLLTQHFANLNMLSFEEQVLIYQIFADYFLPSQNLVIKPHPDDLMYYSQLFPEAQVIRERFPSEFMPFIFDNQPDCVATVSSTAIYNLRGHYREVLELDSRYEHDFPMTHRYYAAVCVARALGSPVNCMGANEALVRRLMDTLDGENMTAAEGPPRTMIVDDVTERGEGGRREILALLENLDERSAVIFINSKADYCWYDYERKGLWKCVVPIVLEKRVRKPRGQDFYADTSTEVIYLYSKSEEVRRMAQTEQIQKELPHTGINLERTVLTEEQERIKVLEGILAATEKRLLHYINREREKG